MVRWWWVWGVLVACAAEPGGRDAEPADGGARDAEPIDAGRDADAAPLDAEVDAGSDADAAPLDADPADVGPDAAADAQVMAYGFAIRSPTRRTVPCDGMFCGGTTTEADDIDLLCTLEHGADRGRYVYVAARPVEQVGFMGLTYAVDAAFLSDGVVAEPITARYDFGGNHHNDALTIERPDHTYRYYHSSFGFGFRKCQPPDCLEVYTPAGALEESGCAPARTLPVICVEIEPGPVVPPLVDTFMKCPGDT